MWALAAAVCACVLALAAGGSPLVPAGGSPLVPADEPAGSQCLADLSGCWPSAMILGAQKAATTSLHSLLVGSGAFCDLSVGSAAAAAHEPVWPCLGDSECKETHFWDKCSDDDGAGAGAVAQCAARSSEYRRLFRPANCPSRRYVDSTPVLHCLECAERLLAVVPSAWAVNMRLLAILREPLSRDLSWYNHRIAMPDRAERMFCDPAFQPRPGLLLPTYANESACVIATINAGLERDGTGATFDVFEGRWSAPISRHSAHLLATAAPALPMGVYSPQLKVWRQVAGRRGLLVWNFAAMLDDVQGHVNELTSFFGLPHVHADELPQDNVLDSPDKLSEMECQTRATLSAWFEPFNQELYQQLDADQASGDQPHEQRPFQRFEEVSACTTHPQPPPLNRGLSRAASASQGHLRGEASRRVAGARA